MVMLAHFDKNMSNDNKQLMAISLVSCEKPEIFEIGKHNFKDIIDKLVTSNGEKLPLSVFITEVWTMVSFLN